MVLSSANLKEFLWQTTVILLPGRLSVMLPRLRWIRRETMQHGSSINVEPIVSMKDVLVCSGTGGATGVLGKGSEKHMILYS